MDSPLTWHPRRMLHRTYSISVRALFCRCLLSTLGFKKDNSDPTGRSNRTVAKTSMNLKSSRSHSVFTIHLTSHRHGSEVKTTSKVCYPCFGI